jgi:hypothetical protein
MMFKISGLASLIPNMMSERESKHTQRIEDDENEKELLFTPHTPV